RVAAGLEEQRALQRSHGPPQTTGGRLRRWRGIRLHDGSPRATVRAKAANRAQESRERRAWSRGHAGGKSSASLSSNERCTNWCSELCTRGWLGFAIKTMTETRLNRRAGLYERLKR